MEKEVLVTINVPLSCFVCRYKSIFKNCPCYIGLADTTDYRIRRHPQCPIKEINKEYCV